MFWLAPIATKGSKQRANLKRGARWILLKLSKCYRGDAQDLIERAII
jgi:hypothetical protein